MRGSGNPSDKPAAPRKNYPKLRLICPQIFPSAGLFFSRILASTRTYDSTHCCTYLGDIFSKEIGNSLRSGSMRAPLCSESTDLCPEDQGLGSDSESLCEIQVFEKCRFDKTTVFGICLNNLMGTTPRIVPQIPFILSRICQYIEEHGLHSKHLFLEGDERNLVESLKVKFIESGDAPLEATGNVASVAKLLIVFIEELPEPLIPVSAQPDFIKDMEKLSLNTRDCVSHLKHSVRKLPDSAYHVLKYLSRFLLCVASHKEYNGMNTDSLSVIFGPLIFRIKSDDPLITTSVKNIVTYFVRNYHAIFEDNQNSLTSEDAVSKSPNVTPDVNRRRQLPCPSSVMPVMTLMPLSVVIPPVERTVQCDNQSEENVRILLMERPVDGKTKLAEDKPSENVNRKRKERRLSGEDNQPRSSSEERPAPTSLVSLEKLEYMRRCSSQEEMKEGTEATEVKLEAFLPTDIPKNNSCTHDSYSSDMVASEKSHSPHPPNAKRREVEANSTQSHFNFMPLPWSNSSSFNAEISMYSMPERFNRDTKQNSLAELEATSMDCDASESLDIEKDADSLKYDSSEFLDIKMTRIPRSASCPVPNTDSNRSSEEESSSLSLSWSMLFESEDSEPVRSEHRYSWPLTKEAQEDAALLSPSVQSLRKSSYHEAPLSPSAFRSYLSYRGHHLDPSVPPSPPVEQEDFAKNIEESSVVSDSIKHLTRKIHCIKKKIRKFDERFEDEFGYKPSHAEKTNHPEAQKLMNDLHKARKELKALKEESHLEQVSPASWHASKSSHILGDSTNQVVDGKDKSKPSVEESFGLTMKSLADERKLANRPEAFEQMTTQQMKDEKLAIQMVLLQFESIHGKPSTKAERITFRPLYDRYRNVKRLLVRSGSFPGATNKKDLCSELQPILEHETLDLTSPQQRTYVDISEDVKSSEPSSPDALTDFSKTASLCLDDVKNLSGSSVLSVKYDNSNIHELPLSEMIFQFQQVKSQKRHLRKILREFESEFYRLNGRKVQKEDKAPVDSLYAEYKHVKARLKLLEALISKHDQHQLL